MLSPEVFFSYIRSTTAAIREATMIRATARLACAALLLTLAACIGQPRNPSEGPERSILSLQEMERAGYPDAFTTVQTLRPQWLQRRGATSSRAQTIKVYLDGSLLGGPENLRQITVRSISTI